MLFNPSHPGEVLKDYLGGMTVKEAARHLGVTRSNLSRILNGHAGISAAMSVRLAQAIAVHVSRHSHVSAGEFMREHVQPTTAGPARAEDGPKFMQRLVAKQKRGSKTHDLTAASRGGL